MTKKAILLVLICLILVTLVACNDYTDDDEYTLAKLEFTLNADGQAYTLTNAYQFRRNRLTIPSVYEDKDVVAIGDGALQNCGWLEKITIPVSVTSIGDNAFSNCVRLQSLTVPATVKSIGDSAFYKCSELKTVEWNATECKVGTKIFGECLSLATINFSKSVDVILTDIFSGCNNLESIKVDSGNNEYFSKDGILYSKDGTLMSIPNNIKGNVSLLDGLTTIYEKMFYGRSNLTSITIPDSVTSINNSAFSGCSGLIKITGSVFAISAVVRQTIRTTTNVNSFEVVITSGTNIGNNDLSDCPSLTSVTISDSVTSIDENAFKGCTGLTRIIGSIYATSEVVRQANPATMFEVVITSGTNIEVETFMNRVGLTSVTIPDSMASIDVSAFCGCTELTKIHYDGTKEQWTAITKGENWNTLTGDYVIYCTDGTIAKDGTET